MYNRHDVNYDNRRTGDGHISVDDQNSLCMAMNKWLNEAFNINANTHIRSYIDTHMSGLKMIVRHDVELIEDYNYELSTVIHKPLEDECIIDVHELTQHKDVIDQLRFVFNKLIKPYKKVVDDFNELVLKKQVVLHIKSENYYMRMLVKKYMENK